MKRQLVFILLITLCNLLSYADDKFLYSYGGKELCYKVISASSKTCEVTPNAERTGSVIIPSTALKSENGKYIEYSVIGIGANSFGSRSLTSVSIPNSVTYIGKSAFSYTGLTKISIPNSVKTIGAKSFMNCYSSESLQIGSTVNTIGDSAFMGCSNIPSIIIPKSVNTIGRMSFFGCSALEDIAVEKDNNAYSSIDGVLFDKFCQLLLQYPASKSTEEYLISDNVKTIGKYAFYQGKNLQSIVIPNTVDVIEEYAFAECTNLVSIYCHAKNPPTLGTSVFTDIYTKAVLKVPAQSLNAYRNDPEWGKFQNIIALAVSGDIVTDLCYEYDKATHTATVTYAEQNSLSNYEGLQSVIVPETVEYDGETYTVVGIGNEAFNNCWGLKAVSLPETIQSIGKLAFGYCKSLRSIVIPDAVTIIDNEAFTGCSALASVQIGNSVETIGDYAFFGCTGLSTLHVPESVKTIGENAFMGIHWINEVHAKAETPAEAPISAFSQNAYTGATLVVPDGSLGAYKAHPTWSNFLAIRENGDVPTKIEVVDGAIVVKGIETVRIYNTSGAQVYSGAAGSIKLPAGIYLVATDSVSKKVRL